MQRIILASGSARRRELLGRLGVEFEVKESGYDETGIKTDDPAELVTELAIQKALAVAKLETDALIMGGDTIVVVKGEIVGKPKDEADAERMLRLLSGTKHQVISGLALVNSLTGDQLAGHEEGGVKFKELTEAEINKYVKSGMWKGFAGGYAIQGAAAPFIVEQTGSLSAIVGFPVVLATELLEQMGVMVEIDPIELEIEIKKEMGK
ncbi:MAG: septum formation protein Maf [Microgenomates group bacterium GW2011_GWA1_46_7]|nr:MAG: septum formation protein Maf [Microgenomates group bacterium GW2011_GWA1_46_7]